MTTKHTEPDPRELTAADEDDYQRYGRDVGELAFEVGFEDSPADLWRVLSSRQWNNRKVRHTNWFARREAAFAHANWIMDGRGEVLSIVHYVRDEST